MSPVAAQDKLLNKKVTNIGMGTEISVVGNF